MKYSLITHGNKFSFSPQEFTGEVLYSNDLCSFIRLGQPDSSLVDFFNLSLTSDEEKLLLSFLGEIFPVFSTIGNEIHHFLPDELVPAHFQFSSHHTFFGGSFNPWHAGHSECLRQCPDRSIIVVPDYSPWKENTFKSPLRQLSDITKITKGEFPIYPGFIALDERNPTANWLPHIGGRKCWLMGDDTFFSLLRWSNVQKVLEALEVIYVVPRNHQLEELIKIERQIREIADLKIIFLNEHEYQNLSSTKLRD